jgi:hypothetical protein
VVRPSLTATRLPGVFPGVLPRPGDHSKQGLQAGGVRLSAYDTARRAGKASGVANGKAGLNSAECAGWSGPIGWLVLLAGGSYPPSPDGPGALSSSLPLRGWAVKASGRCGGSAVRP